MKCLAKKTQYQKAENALTTEYGIKGRRGDGKQKRTAERTKEPADTP